MGGYSTFGRLLRLVIVGQFIGVAEGMVLAALEEPFVEGVDEEVVVVVAEWAFAGEKGLDLDASPRPAPHWCSPSA